MKFLLDEGIIESNTPWKVVRAHFKMHNGTSLEGIERSKQPANDKCRELEAIARLLSRR